MCSLDSSGLRRSAVLEIPSVNGKLQSCRLWVSPKLCKFLRNYASSYLRRLTPLWLCNSAVKMEDYNSCRWVGHVARMGEERGRIGSCWGNRRVGDQWGDLGVDGWIILGWISRRWDVGIWTGLGWPRIETGGGRM